MAVPCLTSAKRGHRRLMTISDAQHRLLLDNLTTATLLLNAELRLEYMNPAAEMLLAVSGQRSHGQFISELFTESTEALSSLRQAVEQAHEGRAFDSHFARERGLREPFFGQLDQHQPLRLRQAKMAQSPVELGSPGAGDLVQEDAEVVGRVHRHYWLTNLSHYNDPFVPRSILSASWSLRCQLALTSPGRHAMVWLNDTAPI